MPAHDTTLDPHDAGTRGAAPGTSTRTAYQLKAGLGSRAGEMPDELLGAAIAVVLGWLRDTTGAEPPEGVGAGSFDVRTPATRVRCVAIAEERMWSLRVVQPALGRFLEVALQGSDDGVAIGTRVLTLPDGPGGAGAPHDLLSRLAQRFALEQVRILDGRPWTISTPADLEALHALLVHPSRALPVILISQPDARRGGSGEFLIEPLDLAERTLGTAWVATLPAPLSFEWTARVGKVWSVFLGAVRTYHPGLSFENDSPYDHPILFAERIMAFHYLGASGAVAATALLADRAAHHAATMPVDWNGLRFLDDALIRRAERAAVAAADAGERIASLNENVGALVEKLRTVEADRDEAIALAAAEESRRLATGQELQQVQQRLDALRRAYRERTGEDPEVHLEIPREYSEIPDWVGRHLAGSLELHPRALRGLKQGGYDDVELAARALLLLANEYRNLQLGIEGAHDSFRQECRRLGLDYGRSITRERAGVEGETYFVRHPRRDGPRRFLEWHLRRGTGKDPRHCLAIYFFWDEDSRKVVVGWMPSHLTNRMT